MHSRYIESLLEHTEEHFNALLELSDALQQRKLTFHERNSAERSIQVLVEACIGLSKHVCKKANQQVLGDASSACLKALSLLPECAIEADDLRGAIGMRNAIVHDYLNLDWKIVEQVLKLRVYLNLKFFIQSATHYLASP